MATPSPTHSSDSKLLLNIAEDFGQTVDLTRRIREILANYPEGTTVLKELIQNADDAGATQVRFCLDRRRHGQDSLLFKELAAWQGPALLAHNNAEFSEDDFSSISKLGGSRKEREPWKTGRFGVGFNSVYHLSDLPSFVSGKYIVFFDPHCKFLPNISAANPGKRIDFVTTNVLSHYKDQFQPYCLFGCDMKKAYNGTIFRFPLRTSNQAVQSQLSNQYYSEDDIIHLFEEIHLESSLCMLFLKNIETIEIYDWQCGIDYPDLMFSCNLKSNDAKVQRHRNALKRISNAWVSHLNHSTSIPKQLDSFTLHFETRRYIQAGQMEAKFESFVVVQCMEASTSKIGAMSSVVAKKHSVCLLPWAAVAAKVSENKQEVKNPSVNYGKAFCFLPLPVKTNLPVHVNGFFELSSNRRDIWHGTDMEGMGKIRSDWNNLLLNDVVTSAYCHLLLYVPEFYRTNYSFWPAGSFVEPWATMVVQFYKCISEYPLVYTELDGGRWITPSQAIFHDENVSNSEGLALALIIVGLPVVRLPKGLLHMISDICDFKMICPSFVREYLKKIDINILNLTNHLGFDLLEYCLGDVVDDESTEILSNLPLIPLANGKFGKFGQTNVTLSYFICSEKEHMLLERAKSRLIEQTIPLTLSQRLSQISGSSNINIKALNNADFVMLLPDVLPAEWRGNDEVKWLPGHAKGHPNEIWVQAFWDYLRESFIELAIFDDWPIIPTNGGFLCRAQKSLGIIKSDGKLSHTIEKSLIELGCRAVRSDLRVSHQWLVKCVHLPNPEGILDAISSIATHLGCTYEKMFETISDDQRSELRRFLLDVKWYRKSQLTEEHLQVLKSFPIFELFNSSGCKREFVDLARKKLFIPPSNVDESLIGSEFLHTQSNDEAQMLTMLLSVEQMQRATFFRCRVVNRIGELNSDVRDKAMIAILKELPLLCLESSSLKDELKDLPFVPSGNGRLQPPKDLYDPRIEELRDLLHQDESFPSEIFRNQEILDALCSLGLRTSISPETILKSAYQVEMLQKGLPDEAVNRACLLLSYLEINAAKLFPIAIADGISRFFKVGEIYQRPLTDSSISKKFWNELSSICWCPVLVQPPHSSLPWPSVNTSLAPPRLVRPLSDLWFASASMRILSQHCHSVFLSQKLGWNEPLGGNVIAAQLLELGKNKMINENQALKQVLATVIPKMYALLTEKIGTEGLDVVKAILEGCHWVWVGDRFVTVNEVVLDGPLHLAPYLWVIPADVAVFRDLLIELGVREYLTVQDFTSILLKIAKLKAGTPLDSHELKMVVWILQHLADSTFIGEIFLPDLSGILMLSSELAYDDAPWLLGDTDSGIVSLNTASRSLMMPRFVHANISNDVAEKLGVKSLRRLLLAESADSMNVTLHGSAEAFGQHEALTTRLKHIVDMYADGPGILCELLQNSDDAGASEVRFLLDYTQFGVSSILSPRMSEWQGPALYCCNNSIFTSKDLHAISRIGQDSKLEKPHAVGRFGLGFNSVYHFTDVPSFVSGENFVIFDPHANNLPGVSPSHPGLKIKFVGKGIVRQFPDQCHPYCLFGCDMQNRYNGTLFRFPLRNSVTASQSQIKQAAYSPNMVLNLFKNFQNIASEVLLFLHNVTCIQLYLREGLDKDLKMIYQVERNSSQEKPVYNFIRALKTQVKHKDEFYKRLQNMPQNNLPSECQLIRITRCESETQYVQVWMISEYLGGKNSLKMATDKENRNYGFVPWAGVAAKVGQEYEVNEDRSFKHQDSDKKSVFFEGHAFCFLPLPVKTALPVHVNAYFELSSNRRDIWYGNDMAGGGKLRSEWNCCLLKEASAYAYVQLLASIACELGPSQEFFALWPTDSLSEPWDILSHSVYMLAAKMDLPLLYTTAKSGQWIPPKKAIFPDYSYSQITELRDALTDAGFFIINAPNSLVSKFQENCPFLTYMTPQTLRNILLRQNHTLQRTAKLKTLRYCLSDIAIDGATEKLEGLPLLPLANGMFGTFSGCSTAEKILVVDDIGHKLLRDRLLDRMLDPHIEADVFQKLYDIAQTRSMNISLLSPMLLRDLFPTIFPSDWHGKHFVKWNSTQNIHPSQEWMELLWSYFNIHSADLSLFSEWPLLPTLGEKHLVRLTKGFKIIMGDGWSENMLSVLQKAGCYILSSSFSIKHPQLEDYVHNATASGLLETFLAAAGRLEALPGILKDISGTEMQELRGFLLQRKWFANGCLCTAHIEILKHLSIFRSFGNSSLINLSYSTNILPPCDVDVELLGEEFIKPESEKEESILTDFLGINRLGKQEFYEKYAFKNLGKIPLPVLERTVLNLIKEFPSIEKEVPSLKTILSEAAIIPSADTRLKAPKELYDPRVMELHSLVDRRFFPSGKFSEDLVLDSLICLGLKTSLGLQDLLDSASSITTLALENEQKAFQMGKCLLAHIDFLGQQFETGTSKGIILPSIDYPEAFVALGIDLEDSNSSKDIPSGEYYPMKRENTSFWTELNNISWCPVLLNPPSPELPWPDDLKSLVVPPKIVRPQSQMWNVSATMRILDGELKSKVMMRKLGWLEMPSLSILGMQLINLSEHYTQVCSGSDDSERETGFKQIFDQKIPEIYSLIEDSMNLENMTSLQSMLQDKRWLWVGDGFVFPNQAAFNSTSHFPPYLHVVPSNLFGCRKLLFALGVRESFELMDFVYALQSVAKDAKEKPLSKELLDFVVRVLETIDELVVFDKYPLEENILRTILVPDADSLLAPVKDLVYNDAPWLASNIPVLLETKRLVHPNVPNDLADRLGAKSLRYLSFIDKELTKDLPCLSLDEISNIIAKCGDRESVLFDIIDIADKCKARAVNVVYDKRIHPQTSILQSNLGQYQGPALTIILEGVNLTMEEVCNLQMSPSWSVRGQNNTYGAGLVSCYNISDVLFMVSNECLYLFDPSGEVFAPSFSNGDVSPKGKAYTFQDTDIPQKFADQFLPFTINQNLSWKKSNITILRMPLSVKSTPNETNMIMRTQSTEVAVENTLKNFMKHASISLLFLNSIEAVNFIKWEANAEKPEEYFSVKIDSACAPYRNPFQRKSSRKFQLSNIFNSSTNMTKMNVIDVFINQEGVCIMDRWIVVLSFGCGQTKNIALDRGLLSYNLSPIAGIAVHVSCNGSIPSSHVENRILCPLPLGFNAGLPVSILGCFIVSHDGFRHLFPVSSTNGQTEEASTSNVQQLKPPSHFMWNQELMACVRESYVALLCEVIFSKQESSSKSGISNNSRIPRGTWKMLAEQFYSIWPVSDRLARISMGMLNSGVSDREWLSELLVKPMFLKLSDLPLWKLHKGLFVKATEGMFLSSPRTEERNYYPPEAVCEFLKSSYKVFSVPCEIVKELEDAGVCIKVIVPSMVRHLLRTSTEIPRVSVEKYIELLEYCCSDYENLKKPDINGNDQSLIATEGRIEHAHPVKLLNEKTSVGHPVAPGDALDIMANIGRSLVQFGKGIVGELSIDVNQKATTFESLGSASSSMNFGKWITELKGLPCPTAIADIVRLGKTELWIGNSEQQKILMPLVARFMHNSCLDSPLLSKVFYDHSVQQSLQIKPFTALLLSQNLSYVIPKQWLDRPTSAAWMPWDQNESSTSQSDWLRMFWKNIQVSEENLAFFQQWHLVPAVVHSTVLVKIQFQNLIFFPPTSVESANVAILNDEREIAAEGSNHSNNFENKPNYHKSFTDIEKQYPWIFPFLHRYNVPVFDQNYLDCEVLKCCLPGQEETLGHLIRSKLLRAQQCGHLNIHEMNLGPSDCDNLFSLFANDFHVNSSMIAACSTDDLAFLRSLPIYKTTLGTYTSVIVSSHYTVAENAFFHPKNDWCLMFLQDEIGSTLYKVLGIREYSDVEILLEFCLPNFNILDSKDQEHILHYIYSNWESIQRYDRIVAALAVTKFVTSMNGVPDVRFQPKELLDPRVPIFRNVYRNKDFKFPADRFATDKWLEILKTVGLHCTLDARALLECAKEVEELGKQSTSPVNSSKNPYGHNQVSEEVFVLACSVVEAILEKFASIYGSSFFQPLSEIAFVPAEVGLPIANGITRQKVLTSYKEVVLMEDWPLAWTCSPILMHNNMIPPKFSWSLLHIQSPPQIQTVLRHLQIVAQNDGEDILARWPSGRGMITVEDTFLEILKYLDKNWGKLSNVDRKFLQNISFIPVSNGTRLCCARRIFIRLEMNLAPFAFQLSSLYLPFVQLLTDLGMQEIPTFSRMQNLLYEMQNACRDRPLNPNELRAVFKILDFLCEIIGKKQANSLGEAWIVPDDSGKLVYAEACVYIDGSGSRMMDKVDTSKLKFIHPFVEETSCILLGIKKLSEVVIEVVSDSPSLEYREHFGSISKSTITERLKNSSFQLAVWVLIQDFSREMPHFKPWTRFDVEQSLGFAADHLECVKHIYTKFIVLESNLDITKQNVKNEGNKVYEYVNKKYGKILLAEPPDFLSGLGILSVMVSRVLESPVCLPISCLFGESVGFEAQAVERLRIRATHYETQRIRNKDHCGIIPGNELSANDSICVQIHPLRPYYAGEIVAWCTAYSVDTKMRYGIVVEDVRPPSGQALYYLRVETTPGEVQQLPSSNVFSFKNMTLGNDLNLSDNLTLSVSSQVEESVPEDSLAEIMNGTEGTFPKNVQAEAVVQAVNDMMAAVGVPLGFDQQDLLKETLTLQEDLKAIQLALSLEKKRADQAMKEADTARASWLCRVCLNSEVNSLLLPCGHVLCQSCSSAVQKCPFCRITVTTPVHLYRP